jgi:hypothetical protein
LNYELTKKILAALEREKVRYVVLGAVAINLLGLARATEDLDLFIAPEALNIERLKAALRSVFDDPTIDEIKTEELLGEYPAIEYVPPEGTFHIDMVTRLGEAFRFEDLEAQTQDFDGVPVSVATPKTLYRMKKDTVRLRDRADAETLKRRFRIDED